MKIGILGGTFDPIHQAHLKLAREAKKQFALERIIFIPALIPPHKLDRRDVTPAPYRYEMVQRAISEDEGFEISDIEMNRAEVSFTVATLRELRKQYPHDDFFWLLGTDMLANLSFWKDPEEVMSQVTFLVAMRPGSKVKPPLQCRYQMINMEPIDLSSSKLRLQIAEGKTLSSERIPKSVMEYIQKMNLYRGNSTCRP